MGKVSLSVKTVFLLFGVLGLGCLTLVIHLSYSVAPAFQSIERETTKLHVSRISNTMQRDLDGMVALAEDWGHWDLTYDFIDTRNQEYIDANLSDSTFVSLDINGVAYMDLSGNPVWLGGYDIESENRRPDIKKLLDSLPLESFLISSTEVGHKASGFVSTDYGPAMIAAVDISDSMEIARPKGTIIFIRFVNKTYIRGLEEQSFRH